MKKILIVSFFSPPSSAIGTIRITKFTKYLLRFGWDVTLLTVKEKYFENLNPETLKDIDGARVIRTKIIKPIKGLKEWGIYWLPYLKSELDKLLRTERFDISLWTGNPFYQWILAPYFNEKFGLKYVLDFRDEWSMSNFVKKWQGSNFYRFKRFVDNKIAKILEPYILKKSSAIINVTDEITELYKNKYKKKKIENFFTIYNGFDLEDLKIVKQVPKKDFFEIIFPGRFGKFLNPINLMKAIKFFVNEENISENDLKLTLVGSEKEIKVKAEKIGIKNYINFLESKSYDCTLGLIKRADLGLLILHSVIDTSTKIFDYLALKTKIFCVTDTMDARGAKICKEYGNAIIVKNDIQNIKEGLKKAFYLRGDLTINPKVLEFYNREFQTKQLEYILNEVIEGRL